MSNPFEHWRVWVLSIAVAVVFAVWSIPPAFAEGEDAAFREFAERAEASIAAGDGSFLNAALDFDALLDISMRGLTASPELVQKFRGATYAMGQLGSTVADALKQGGGSYRLLSLRHVGGRPQALFRMVHANGLNYHELALGRDATGAMRVVDFHVFSAGEWASAIVRRNWLDALVAEGAAQKLGLTGFDFDYSHGLIDLQAVSNLAKEGRFDAALEALLRLPASVQSIAPALLLRVQIAKRVGEARYTEAVDALARRASTEPPLNLLLHEMYWTRGESNLALAALEGLRQAVGDDAYLDFLRGSVLYQRRDAPDVVAAKRAFEQAVSREPSLPNPHMALLQISLAEKDYADTARLLTGYEPFAQSGTIEKLIALDDFAAFVRSNEYRNWHETRRAFGQGAASPAPVTLPDEAVRVGGAIPVPRRIVNVDPVYPEIAQQARVQGVVILECTVSAEGRVAEVKILRSIPLLDQAAIDAAKQWVYEQTFLEEGGPPVPVILTAVANFSLNVEEKNR